MIPPNHQPFSFSNFTETRSALTSSSSSCLLSRWFIELSLLLPSTSFPIPPALSLSSLFSRLPVLFRSLSLSPPPPSSADDERQRRERENGRSSSAAAFFLPSSEKGDGKSLIKQVPPLPWQPGACLVSSNSVQHKNSVDIIFSLNSIISDDGNIWSRRRQAVGSLNESWYSRFLL